MYYVRDVHGTWMLLKLKYTPAEITLQFLTWGWGTHRGIRFLLRGGIRGWGNGGNGVCIIDAKIGKGFE